MYSLVEFQEESGDGSAMIRTDWLTPRKKEPFWSCVKEQHKFEKILKRREAVDPGSYIK